MDGDAFQGTRSRTPPAAANEGITHVRSHRQDGARHRGDRRHRRRDRPHHACQGRGGRDLRDGGAIARRPRRPACRARPRAALRLANTEDVESLVPAAEKAMGHVDILVNNAGITRDQLFMRMKDEDWDEVLAVDLTAAFRLARAAVRGMMRRRFGRIIGIASVVGVTGNAGQANYAAAKAGMIAMTKSLAQEVASRGITVNVIAPGFIETAMTDVLTEKQKESILARVPAGRLGAPDDIAAAALYLASNEGAYVTGQTLHVNGGMAMI